MSDPDYKHMARQFMDLWEKQVSSVMTDKDLIRTTMGMMQGLGANFNTGTHGTKQQATANTAFSADAHDDGLGKLERRIARLEERVRELEDAKPARPARKPATKPQISRSAKKRKR